MSTEQQAQSFYNNTPAEGIEGALLENLRGTPEYSDGRAVRAQALSHTVDAHAVGLTGPEYAATLRASHRVARLPATEREALRTKAMDGLRGAFGADADAALAAAGELAKRSPAAAKLLADGAGDDPETVLAFARAAMRGKR